MTTLISIVQNNVFKALGDFMKGVLLPSKDANGNPVAAGVAQAQVNRVPEMPMADFVMMNVVGQTRLSTNVDGYADALFTGSIAGNVMTISAVEFGTIFVGSPVFGVGVMPNTYVIALGTGTGGTGTYQVNNAQTIASEFLACGVSTKLQPMQVTVQLDVHGPQAADNAAVITTLFRDDYGVQQIQGSGFDITPLYTSEPKQIPFTNEAQQIEQRWVIDAELQCNVTVTVLQQFADSLAITLVEVDATYPPAP